MYVGGVGGEGGVGEGLEILLSVCTRTSNSYRVLESVINVSNGNLNTFDEGTNARLAGQPFIVLFK